MMDFEKAFLILCSLEGYSSSVTGDPGKLTVWGITETYYPDDVKKMINMSPEEAKEYAKGFYLNKYWNRFQCDSMSYPYNIIFFCMVVNMENAAKKARNETDNWRDFLFKCQLYYNSLVEAKKDMAKFFRGWINRTLKLWSIFYKEV
jgi:hypothetical protein